MKAKIEVKSLLSVLDKTFSDNYTVIQEVLQNSKRAKATKITIFYEEDTGALSISNNGVPIEDFQDLIHVAHSGWKPQPEGENPYGLGFLSVIFASTEPVTIISNCKTLTIDTEALKRGEDIGEPLEIPNDTDTEHYDYAGYKENETTISLTVPGLTISAIRERIAFFSPEIEVSVNGLVTSREPISYTLRIPEGEVQVLSDLAQVRIGGTIPMTYQGFRTQTQGGSYSNDSGYVVKIDQTLFDARLPDRSFILGFTPEVERRLKGHVTTALIEICEKQASTEDLLCSSRLLASLNAMYIFNKLKELPPALCYTPETMDEVKHREYLCNSTDKKVLKTDVVVKVSSLTVSTEDNYAAFDTAYLLNGSVSVLYGNTPVMSPEERGVPDRTSCIPLEGFLESDVIQNVYFFNKPTDSCKFHIDQADLFINLAHKDADLWDILETADNYEDKETGAFACQSKAQDVETLQFAIRNMELSAEGNLPKLFEEMMRHKKIRVYPEAFRGRQFTLIVNDKGEASIKEF